MQDTCFLENLAFQLENYLRSHDKQSESTMAWLKRMIWHDGDHFVAHHREIENRKALLVIRPHFWCGVHHKGVRSLTADRVIFQEENRKLREENLQNRQDISRSVATEHVFLFYLQLHRVYKTFGEKNLGMQIFPTSVMRFWFHL